MSNPLAPAGPAAELGLGLSFSTASGVDNRRSSAAQLYAADPSGAETVKYITSLENELADTKQLLADTLYDKQTLEKEKIDLQRLVEELTGQHSHQEEDTVHDRAKATILQLRLKRIEQKRNQFIDFVKTQGRTAGLATRKVRSSLAELRTEINDQMSRMQDHLAACVGDFETIVNLQNARQFGLDDPSNNSGSGTGVPGEKGSAEGYLNMVAAAVQQQQKSIILAADHPLVVKLTVMYGSIDVLVETLNAIWRDMSCFVDGRPPQITRPRRYIDTMANAQNYSAQIERLIKAVKLVHASNKLRSDLRLPLAMRHSHHVVFEADAALKEKIASFFNSLRVVRTSVVVKTRNLPTALKVFTSVDAIQYEAARIAAQYSKLSKVHVLRVLKFMAALIRYSRTPAAEYGPADESAAGLPVGECKICTAPVHCEDCFRVRASQHPAQKAALEEHRRRVTQFTLQRVEHFKKVSKLIDDAVALLVKHRLVPLDQAASPEAADRAVDEILRKPHPPTSINYFTKLRQSQENRLRIMRGELPDESEGLAVTPPTLTEQREALAKMLAATNLSHVPESILDDVQPPHTYHEALHGPIHTMHSNDFALATRVLPPSFGGHLQSSPRTAPSTPGWGNSTQGGSALTSRRGRRNDVSTRAVREAAAAGGLSAARGNVEDHLPLLFGPRSVEAAQQHQLRLDSVRRHMVRTSEGPRGEKDFSTTKTPRSLTERVLGPQPQQPQMPLRNADVASVDGARQQSARSLRA